MIPYLYEYNETAFTSNGLGRLTDCLSCIVTEERNGIYELKMTYPINGVLYDEIREGRILGVIHDDQKDVQPFDIYGRSAPMDGVVTFFAHHVSYRLGNIILRPFTATSVGNAFSKMKTETYNANPFSYWTDKATAKGFTLSTPMNAKEILGGVEGSILDVYGVGEYVWDKFTVRLYESRGRDTDVRINYGTNLIDLVQDVDVSGTYTAVVPFWLGYDGTLVTLPEGILESQDAQDAGYTDVVPVTMDLSGEFAEKPSVNELRNKAQALMSASQPWIPDETIEVDFVALWQTEQYSSVEPLQRLSLCDTALVSYPALGITNARLKIVRVEYDVLRERFSRMELGKARVSFADVVKASTEERLKEVPTGSVLQTAIQTATDLITGATGGYVKFKYDADGKPIELLIMDAEDEADAVNIWRYNVNGWGVSRNGGATYTTAATIDGGIVADFITAGTLTGLQINNGAGTFEVDSAGHVEASDIDITGGGIDLTSTSASDNRITLRYQEWLGKLAPSGILVLYNNSKKIDLEYDPMNGYGFLELVSSSGILKNTIKPNELTMVSSTVTRTKLLNGALELYGSGGKDLAKLGVGTDYGWLYLYDNNGTRRVRLGDTGLYFYDSGGNLTKTYSAT